METTLLGKLISFNLIESLKSTFKIDWYYRSILIVREINIISQSIRFQIWNNLVYGGKWISINLIYCVNQQKCYRMLIRNKLMHQNKNLISLLNINKLLHKPKPVLVPGTFHLLNCFVNMPKYGFFSIFKTFVQQNLRIQSSLVLNWHRIKIIQRFCKKSQLH